MYIDGANLKLSTGELSAKYITPVRDNGYIATFKIAITTIVTVSGSLAFDSDPATRFSDDASLRFSGAEVLGATSFEVKTSDDNITWSDWIAWQQGDYACRYFQLRMTMTRSSLSQNLACSEFSYYTDLPSVDENQEGEVTDTGTGEVITFTKTFHEDPIINVTILTGNAYVWKATSLSTTGVTIKLYQLDGTSVVGTYRIHAHGV